MTRISLFLSNDIKDKKAKGVISLNKCFVTAADTHKNKKRGYHCFTINYPEKKDARAYIIAAQTEKER